MANILKRTYAPSEYDLLVLSSTGAIWYSLIDNATPSLPSWPLYAATLSGNYADESQRGLTWFDAWWQESGQVTGLSYANFVTSTGDLWFSSLDTELAPIDWPTYAEAVAASIYTTKESFYVNAWVAEYAPSDWPSLATAISDDAATKLGPVWAAAFANTVTNDAVITAEGPIWRSPLGDLNTPPDWPTYTEAIAANIDTTRGPAFATAWTNEYATMEWPAIATSITDDARTKLGTTWIAAYEVELALPNDDVLTETGQMWYSPLDTLTEV